MEYLVGLFTGVAVIGVFGIGLLTGRRINKQQHFKPPEVNEHDQLEMKKLNDDFKKLFGYDVAQATARKEVK